MSRTLLLKDNISIAGDIKKTGGIDTQEGVQFCLHFNILVNGKLKVWSTYYELEPTEQVGNIGGGFKVRKYGLKDYNAWNDIKDLLQTIGYDLEEANIKNWLEQFEI